MRPFITALNGTSNAMLRGLRIDPDTGEVRAVTPEAASEPALADSQEVLGGELSADLAKVQAELTEDLQRLTAEYANYRKRVDRDRMLAGDNARAGLLEGLLPLLDDIDRARQHGDLTGGFKGVAPAASQALTYIKIGLGPDAFIVQPFTPAEGFDLGGAAH